MVKQIGFAVFFLVMAFFLGTLVSEISGGAIVAGVYEWCGDGTCNNNENCTTCEEDCGECEIPEKTSIWWWVLIIILILAIIITGIILFLILKKRTEEKKGATSSSAIYKRPPSPPTTPAPLIQTSPQTQRTYPFIGHQR